MSSNAMLSSKLRTVLAGAMLALVGGGLVACDGSTLDVDDPDNVPDRELTADRVGPRLNGMVDDFRSTLDFYVLYSGLLTDEFSHSGTFPTRAEIDARQPSVSNGSIAADVWDPLSVSRATADVTQQQFRQVANDPSFAGVRPDVLTGITHGKLFGGYTRIYFAELFCRSILGGQDDLPQFGEDEDLPIAAETSPVRSAERMRQARDSLLSAAASADSLGFPQVATAARIGAARANMFLGNFADAASLVDGIDPGFTFTVEFSDNTPATENSIFQLTWGVNSAERWTIGVGTANGRSFEVFAPEGRRTFDAAAGQRFSPGFDEWASPGKGQPETADGSADIGQGLVMFPNPTGVTAFNGATPLGMQTLYAGRSGTQGRSSPIVIASGWEAEMYEAEAMLRGGSPEAAEDLVNDLLEQPEQADNPITTVQPTLTTAAGAQDFTNGRLSAFEPVDFGDESLEGDLKELARAYEAGLWLTGHRQHYLRRLEREFPGNPLGSTTAALGLYPPKPGDAISLPVPLAEIDNNENIDVGDNGCPVGSGLP